MAKRDEISAMPDWAPLPAGVVVSDPRTLARALEAVRRQVCAYSVDPCGCKYGRTEDTRACWSEQTGCPELRCVIEALLRVAERPS